MHVHKNATPSEEIYDTDFNDDELFVKSDSIKHFTILFAMKTSHTERGSCFTLTPLDTLPCYFQRKSFHI